MHLLKASLTRFPLIFRLWGAMIFRSMSRGLATRSLSPLARVVSESSMPQRPITPLQRLRPKPRSRPTSGAGRHFDAFSPLEDKALQSSHTDGMSAILRHPPDRDLVGTFRFTGEGNYTSAETITAKGSTGTPVTNFCGAFEGSGNGHHPHVDHHRPPPSQSLQAVTANHLLIFQALAGGNPRRVQFFANLKETIGAISIVRFIATGGPASDFLLAQNPDGATIAPRLPLLGARL